MYLSAHRTVQLGASLVTLCFFSAQVTFSQGMLVNGDFDFPAPGVGWEEETTYAGGFIATDSRNGGIPGWRPGPGFDGTYGQVAWWHVPRAQWAEIGYYFLPSGLQQTFATVPRQAYEVTFTLGTPNHGQDPTVPGVLMVSVENWGAFYTAPATDGQPGGTPPLETHKFYFEAGPGGSTTLLFQNLAQAVVLDSVSVSAIPEPNALGILGLAGVLGASVRGWRRRVSRS